MNDKLVHPPVKCRYCNKDAPYTPLEKYEKLGIKIYFCVSCQAEYVFQHEHAWSESIYISIGHRMFRWTLIGRSGQIWHIGKPGVPGHLENQELSFLKEFRYNIPNITPNNIHQKLQTWLPFL